MRAAPAAGALLLAAGWLGYGFGLATGCGSPSLGTCTYNGKGYGTGASFQDVDGCNTCTCQANGQVACTLIGCPAGGGAGGNAAGGMGNGDSDGGSSSGAPDAAMPSSGAGCLYAGMTYPVGSNFPATDGCNTCTCVSVGMAACTEKACDPDGGARDGASAGGTGGTSISGGGSGGAAGATGVSSTGGTRGTGGAGGVTDSGSTGGATTGSGGGTAGGSGSGPTSTGGATGGSVSGCTLPFAFTYGLDGGLRAYVDTAKLTPPNAYQYGRDMLGNAPPVTCSPALPACNDPQHIDAGDIAADLANADVLAAFAAASPPLFGRDSRPVDGTVMVVRRLSDGHGLIVGDNCTTIDDACIPPPAGVAKLVADLKALDQQQLADPACATLAP